MRPFLFVLFISILQLVWTAHAETLACSTVLLSQTNELTTDESVKPNLVTAYLKLLDYLISGIKQIDVRVVSESEKDGLIRELLLNLQNSPLPANPMKLLSLNPYAPQLSLLAHGNYFSNLIQKIGLEDWREIQSVLVQKTESIANLITVQTKTKVQSAAEFLDQPDNEGRTRLHELIQNQEFSEALLLVQNPLVTMRYLNQVDFMGRSALDSINDYFDTFVGNSTIRVPAKSVRVPLKLLEPLVGTLVDKGALTGAVLRWTAECIYTHGNSLSWKIANSSALQCLKNKALSGKHIAMLSQYLTGPPYQFLRKMLEIGISPNWRNEEKYTALHTAATFRQKHSRDNWEYFTTLLDFGADAAAESKYRKTPLMLAAEGATVEAVELLIARGAKINVASTVGSTAFLRALRNKSPIPMLNALVRHGADVSAALKTGKSAVELALSNEVADHVRKLIEASRH